MDVCTDCGHEHMNAPCGMTFAERIRTVQVDRASMETAELRNYYDRESITNMFGHDAKDRYYEETDGRGAAFAGPDGKHYRRDRRSGDIVEASPSDYLQGDLIG